MSRPKKEVVTCSNEGCLRPSRSKGLCSMHYQRQRDTSHLVKPVCLYNNCETESYTTGLCFKHYQQQRNARIVSEEVIKRHVALKKFISFCPTCYSTDKPIPQAQGKEISLVCSSCGFTEKF